MALKHIRATFTEEDYAFIQRVKNESGLSWDVFILKAAESYDVYGEVE